MTDPNLPVTFTDAQQGFAMERFGKPITELSRRQQRLVERFVIAEVDELEGRIKLVMEDLAIDAVIQKSKGMECADKLADIMAKLGTDIQALQATGKEKHVPYVRPWEDEPEQVDPDTADEDVESVTTTDGPTGRVKSWVKTPRGKLRREMLFTKQYAQIAKIHADLTDQLALAPGGKGTVIVGKVENTQNNYGEAAAIDKLGKFMDAEPGDS